MQGSESVAGATAELKATAGEIAITTTVRFQERGAKLPVAASIAGLKTGAGLGSHLKEKGD